MDTHEKIIELCFSAISFSDEILKSVVNDFSHGKMHREGKTTYGELKKGNKLENIEVSENNLKEFNKIAGKYDLSYAVKVEKNTGQDEKRNFHIFFKTKDVDTMKRAFHEYTSKTLEETKNKKAEISREQLKQVAERVEHTPKKDKIRERNKDVSL